MPAKSPEALARKYARKNAKRRAACAAAKFGTATTKIRTVEPDPSGDDYQRPVCRSWRHR
jgi:hypothetical protein